MERQKYMHDLSINNILQNEFFLPLHKLESDFAYTTLCANKMLDDNIYNGPHINKYNITPKIDKLTHNVLAENNPNDTYLPALNTANELINKSTNEKRINMNISDTDTDDDDDMMDCVESSS
eukprot:242610_1